MRVCLHGDPILVLPEGRSVGLERRAAALLALVAFEPGISRSRVAAMVWPDSSDPRRNLRQQLLRFRQQFGQPLVDGGDALTLAVATLEPPADGEPQAAALLGGLSYGDCEDFDVWLQQRRDALHARLTKALDDAVSLAENEQRLSDAIGLALRRVADEPTSEAHHRNLIRLHYLNQDASQARACFEVLQRMLRDEYGASPSDETVALMQLLSRSGSAVVEPSPPPVPVRIWATALQRPPRLIGRATELQALRDGLALRQAWLLLGEGGMGKTRLVTEALRHVDAQVLVKAQAGDAGVPFATLARLLRRLLEQQRLHPEPGALARLLPEAGAHTAVPSSMPLVQLPADGERLMLQAAVERVFLLARLQVAVVDDLHFADDASVDMLTALASAEPLCQMAWVFTQRPGEGSSAVQAMRDALEEAQRLEVVALAPLDAAQIAELIQSLQLPDVDAAALGQRLLAHTGGNPLFALETLKQMLLYGKTSQVLPKPASVGALIDRRLKQLSPAALALARVAALAGPDFDPVLAEAVLSRRAIDLADAWSELEQAQVLRERSFAHDLVQEAAQRSVPTAIAQHLHAAIAAHLEQRQGEPARLAGHWLAAAEPRRALPWLVKAADQARDGLRRREEAGFLERAAGIQAQRADPDVASAYGLWLRAHQALECVDGQSGAMHALDQALAHAQSERERLSVLAIQVSAQVKQIDLTAAITNGREALRLALKLGDARLMVNVLMPLVVALASDGQTGEATALLDAHWPALAPVDDLEPTVFIEHGTVLTDLGRPMAARASFRRGIERALECGQHSEFVIGSKNLAVNHIDTGEIEAGMVLLESAERMRLAHDDLHGSNLLSWNLQAMALRDLGQYGLALARFDTAMAVTAVQLPARLPLDRLHRAWLWAKMGQWARAQQDMAAHDDYAGLPTWVQARALQLRARLAQWRGMPAGDALLRARALLAQGALRTVTDSITIDAERVSGMDSPRAAAAACSRLQSLRDQAAHDGYWGVQWAAEWACAQLALAAGQGPAARALLETCWNRPPAQTPQDCAMGHWWHGLWQVARQLGAQDQAEAARAEGVAWIHRTLQAGLPSAFHASFRDQVVAHRELMQRLT